MSSRPMDVPPPSVVAAIVVRDATAVGTTFEAVGRQVYEPASIIVVGGDARAKNEATALGVPWQPSIPHALEDLAPSSTHIWLIASGSSPRPDALGALVAESGRVDAGVAGSKLLSSSRPDQLVSIGYATDVFDVPFVGLDEDEIDAGQYDVVRDVAVVALDSMLVRRDLAKGVAGLDPQLSIEAAAIDLCQRARMRGARIVVAPSSEVLVPEPAEERLWKIEAGRIRAMLKAYSLLTLLWVVPTRFAIGLLEAIAAPFVGRWTLLSWLRSWWWNLTRLPSTFQLRRAARRGDTLGDAELFRYQLRGSATLRRLAGEIGASLRRRLPGDDRFDIVAVGRELRQPAFVVGALAVLFSLAATRTIWGDGFPAVGYSLPLPSSGSAAVGAYAGGWNPAGFGSTEPLLPFIGLAGALQLLLFDRPDLAAATLTLAAMLLGVWGTTRLLRTIGVGPVPGLIAGIVLVAGPAARTIAGETGLGALLALGVVPWPITLALATWPSGWWRRIGRLAGIAWLTGLTGLLSPAVLVVPAGAVVVWALLHPQLRSAWIGSALAAGGALLAIPMLLPWLSAGDVVAYLDDGAAFWEPGLVLAALAGIALLAGLVAAPSRLASVVAWGGIVGIGGAFLARASDLGVGRELALAGLAAAGLGTAAVVGGVLEGLRRVDEVVGWRRFVLGFGAVAAAGVAASSLLVVLPGRAGLPRDAWSDPLRFVAATEGAASSRILIVGPGNNLPGDHQAVRGATYRVVSSPLPELWEARLPEAHPPDDALRAALESVIDRETFRAGETLAPFGIRWIVVAGETPLEEVFAGQLDMVPLDGLRLTTFANEAPGAVRAIGDSGETWTKTPDGYEGPTSPDGRVFLAESPSDRWGPGPWIEAGWGNEVSTSEGEAVFAAIPQRQQQAVFAAAWFVLLLAVAWLGRHR